MRFLVTWITLAAFWILLSGHWDTLPLVVGFFSVTLVTLISYRHIAEEADVGVEFRRLLRLIRYLPWLVWQIVLANVDVLLRVLGFRAIEPCVIRFQSGMKSEFGVATLANSITLTPGTVTVRADEEGNYVVHALAPEFAKSVLDGDMVERVRKVEGEADPAPKTDDGATNDEAAS